MVDVSAILDLLRSIGALLIVSGVVMAFAYRVAYYLELISGFIVTLLASYFVWNITQNLVWTVLAFVLFIIGTFASAAAASMIAVLDGFVISLVGFVGLLFPPDISQITPTFIFMCAIYAAVSTVFGVGLGSLASRVTSATSLTVPRVRRVRESGDAYQKVRKDRAKIILQCPHCGSPLSEQTIFCPNCQRCVDLFVKRTLNMCIFCGSRLLRDDPFCPKCGRSQT